MNNHGERMIFVRRGCEFMISYWCVIRINHMKSIVAFE